VELGDLEWRGRPAVDLAALEQVARGRLDPAVYDYVAGGADSELTLADNLAAWDRVRLRPRVLRDVRQVDTATTLLGVPLPAPILVAPTGYHELVHPQAEEATAAGAAAAGSLMVVSTQANRSVEQVAAAAPGAPRWFQVYVHVDHGFTEEVVGRAAAAGYSALVLTADLPVLGNRLRDLRNRLRFPPGMVLGNAVDRFGSTGEDVVAHASQFEAGLEPATIAWLARQSGLPVLVKGVLRGDDAEEFVAAGAAGIVVSNHGGRQLDGALAAADALPEVVAAVAGQVPVLVDGGVRRGTDVVKALSLGAGAVLVGRPVLWGLAAAGAEGVRQVLAGLQEELVRAMALCGATSLAALTPDLVTAPG
jgi:4-hydroxymandelate oxidase